MAWAVRHADVTVALRAALVVAWQVVGWWIVVVCFAGRRRRPPDRRLSVRAGWASGGRAREALP